MTSKFSDMKSPSIFFDVVLFLLLRLVTGQSFMSISSLVLELWQFPFIRDWPEIRKLDIWRLGRVTNRNTKFGLNVSNKMLLNAAKCQGYNFYRFWVIKRNQPGGEVKITPDFQLKVKTYKTIWINLFI